MKRGQPALRLKRGRDAARNHPWIFKGDVADVSDVEPGAAVTVVDSAGRFVGRGFYNPRPALCCRVVTWADEPLDSALLERRLRSAVALRARGASD
ncbi:MAG: rRNA large subunit methyltransferase I, partial [Candidatus Rokuibacteriota bacterium]